MKRIFERDAAHRAKKSAKLQTKSQFFSPEGYFRKKSNKKKSRDFAEVNFF